MTLTVKVKYDMRGFFYKKIMFYKSTFYYNILPLMCLTEEIIEKARQWVLLVIILIVYNNCNFRGSSQFKENEKEVFGALKIVCFCFLWRKVYEETTSKDST